jgi:ADP-ribose pyrophosphatase YjhB (NUDIX family)
MSRPTIRPIAICIFRQNGCLLVGRGRDEQRNETYYRPPGGAIEFGERALEAVRREIREEIHAEIESPQLLGVLENTFQLEGEPKHELVFVFEARFSDLALYARSELTLYEPGWDGRLTWEPVLSFQNGAPPLYPEGLLDLLGEAG